MSWNSILFHHLANSPARCLWSRVVLLQPHRVLSVSEFLDVQSNLWTRLVALHGGIDPQVWNLQTGQSHLRAKFSSLGSSFGITRGFQCHSKALQSLGGLTQLKRYSRHQVRSSFNFKFPRLSWCHHRGGNCRWLETSCQGSDSDSGVQAKSKPFESIKSWCPSGQLEGDPWRQRQEADQHHLARVALAHHDLQLALGGGDQHNHYPGRGF